MRVAVRVDAGPLIGGGHAMRCLTLANSLAEAGAEIIFVSAAMPKAMADRIKASGYALARIPVAAGLEPTGSDWHEQPLDRRDQETDAGDCGMATGHVDWVIVDHYLLDEHWHRAARRFASNVMVIDDLANRGYDCDLLLDQTFGRVASDYQALVPPNARVLAGAAYALLRPEFGASLTEALNCRKEEGLVRRILLSMGTTDLGGATARILDDVLEVAPDCRIDVVVGASAPSRDHVERVSGSDDRVTVHLDSHNMAALMRDADLAIGAAGTTSWERCCLGLPTVTLVLAENQRPSAAALAQAGAVASVDNVEQIGPAVRALLSDPVRLAQMSAAAFATVDGNGTSRVAAAVLGHERRRSGEVQLRLATMEDAEQLWLWRNDPVTREQSRNIDPITWPSHVKWLRAAFADAQRQIMIATRDGTPIGNIGVHPVADGKEVSIVVAPTERGNGNGREMLELACAEMTEPLYAAVRNDNLASRRLFKSCGFHLVASAEPGFLRYCRSQDQGVRKQA